MKQPAREVVLFFDDAGGRHMVDNTLNGITPEQERQIDAIVERRRERQSEIIIEVLPDGTVRPRAETDEERLLAVEDLASGPQDLVQANIQVAYDVLRRELGKPPSQAKVIKKAGYAKNTFRERWPFIRKW